VSESSRDIMSIVFSARSVRLQTRACHTWPRFRFSASASTLAATRLRYCLSSMDHSQFHTKLYRIFNVRTIV